MSDEQNDPSKQAPPAEKPAAVDEAFQTFNLKKDASALLDLENFLDDRWSLLISTGGEGEGSGPK